MLLKVFGALVLMLLVSGCVASEPGNIGALKQSVTPLMKDHALALARCNEPVCDEAVITGQRAIAAYQAGVGTK